MRAVSLHDRAVIEGRLRENPELHIYSLGDLDDFFWPNTVWFASVDGGTPREIVLLYTAFEVPNLVAVTTDPEAMRALLREIGRLLPPRFYSHLSPGVEEALEGAYALESHGEYTRMVLRDPHVDAVDVSAVTPLGPADEADIEAFYQRVYPRCWFDPRMLQTGHYYGVREDGGLVSAGGIHVVSEAYGVAALGNIATAEERRGRGYGTAVTARICSSLRGGVDVIGLNVKSDNRAAISIYERLGFESTATYGEYMLELKP